MTEAAPRRLAIETRGLVRRFGDVEAVAGIDLRVPEGSFFGFLGGNMYLLITYSINHNPAFLNV